MEVKFVLVFITILLGLLLDNVSADFYFNRPFPRVREHPRLKLKCAPGRTVMKIVGNTMKLNGVESDSDELNEGKNEKGRSLSGAAEHCNMCICSVDGYNEYCVQRPVDTLNECLIIASTVAKYQKGEPFQHENSLSFRIRRDLIWHNDEIPYNRDSKCYRGHSYYTNHATPNETDINYSEEVTSLLDFKWHNSCFFCVCSVSGDSAACISRDTMFCDYYRIFKSDDAKKQYYSYIFQQDRPVYFRQLSWRVRRTMDNSIFDFIEKVGDNIVDETQEEKNAPAKCVPYVSEYTDCTEENKCDPGCTKCTCSNQEQWNCKSVRDCSEISVLDEEAESTFVDDALFEAAIDKLEHEMKAKESTAGTHGKLLVPTPKAKTDESTELLDIISRYDVVGKLKELSRSPRSPDKKTDSYKNPSRLTQSNKNSTVKFYSTIDDFNEDTLRKSNTSGTLLARRMKSTISDVARRSNIIDNNNNSLHIDLNHPTIINHITDNKIDTNDQENKVDLDHEKLNIILGNKTQKSKDKEISKLVVNELKKGVEIIGDTNAPVISNITFTSQNDTLTAMAFIAGNLLNKLWNMEKDVSGSSLEIDDMKHEKISDLLDLFKEPLNLRQEDFLKHALEQLSNAIEKDIKNVSLCQTIEEASKLIDKDNNKKEETLMSFGNGHTFFENETINGKEDKNIATALALSKINNLLGLIKKFERIQQIMSEIKNGIDITKEVNITNHEKPITGFILNKDDTNTFNIFGNILDKITKLLMPQKYHRKMTNLIKSKSELNNDHHYKNKVMKMYNIDLTNMTVAAKDKLIFDYITHINSNPICVLNKNSPNAATRYLPDIEGNILLNLSEFFKVKSFADLLNVLKTEKAVRKINTLNFPTVTNIPIEMTTIVRDRDKNRTNYVNKFALTKEKLKAHLKTIIEDLIELQNAKDISHRGNKRIAEALPCIYNIINSGKDLFAKKNNVQYETTGNVMDLLKNLKNTLKTTLARRSDSIMRVRPKSAVVLERLIKNLTPTTKATSRRLLDSRRFSLEDVRNIINKIRNFSSVYKNKALFVRVTAAEKVVVLKVLQRDLNLYIEALEAIKIFNDNLSSLTKDQYRAIYQFLSYVANNISTSRKVLKDLEFSKRHILSEKRKSSKILNASLNNTLKRFSETKGSDNDVKISRKQIINHLIKNRLQIYMKLKEAKNLNVHNDINYNIAKRIVFYLDSGNYSLANELYKVLVMQNGDNLDSSANKDYLDTSSKITSHRQNAMSGLQSLMQYEDSKIGNEMKLVGQDQMIKQLLNLKNLE